MCVSRPLEAGLICSRKWASKCLFIFSTLLVLVYTPNAYYKMKWRYAEKVKLFDERNSTSDATVSNNHTIFYNTIIGECSSIPTEFWTNLVMTVMVYVDFIVASLIPFLIMMVYNLLIIQKVVRASITRRSLTSAESRPNLSNLTGTLLAVSFTYMFLTSPSAILVLGWDYFGVIDGYSSDWVRLWRSIGKMLLNFNNALNFVQYAITGEKFRKESKKLLISMVKLFEFKCKEPTKGKNTTTKMTGIEIDCMHYQ